jgi:hypothetical protein
MTMTTVMIMTTARAITTTMATVRRLHHRLQQGDMGTTIGRLRPHRPRHGRMSTGTSTTGTSITITIRTAVTGITATRTPSRSTSHTRPRT